METKRSIFPHDFKFKKNTTQSKIKDQKNENLLISEENLLKKELQKVKKKKERIQEKSTDERKLIQLQKLIDQGQYQMNADELADKIIEKHLISKNLEK